MLENSTLTLFTVISLTQPKNFFNGKRSDVLAKFDIKGKPYEKVSYHSPPQDVLRDCSTGQHINRITLSVKDEGSQLFDFNGLPLEFVYHVVCECFDAANCSSSAIPSITTRLQDAKNQ